MWHLFVEGTLPSLAERAAFTRETAALRELPPSLLELLPAIARSDTVPLAGLRTALSQLAALEDMPPAYDADAATLRANTLRLSAAVPVLIAALHRYSVGKTPIAPRADLAAAANYLYMIDGREPIPNGPAPSSST